MLTPQKMDMPRLGAPDRPKIEMPKIGGPDRPGTPRETKGGPRPDIAEKLDRALEKNPDALQRLREKLGMSREELERLIRSVRGGEGPGAAQPQVGGPGAREPQIGGPAPGGEAPPAPAGAGGAGGAGGGEQAQAAGDAGGGQAAGEAGQQGGGILEQIMALIQQIIQMIQGGQQAGAEQEGGDQKQLLDQIAGAKSMEELQQIIQPVIEQSGGDPNKLPPEIAQAIKQKVQELGGGAAVA